MRTAALAIVISLCSGCAALFEPLPDPGARRKAYVDKHPQLQADLRELILNGQVAVGMHAEHVIASWGEPQDRDRFVSSLGVSETWTYGARRRTQPGPSGFSYIDVRYILRFSDGVLESFYQP